ncbi:HNH endonuclease signature motif containing protein [Yersinia enterocolitica]|uniref:HNH endonuclease signature motif containing protein n=1 Tax=Yersinia enterocolitica TaxID=630 RepID=UPI00398C8DE1
MWKLTLPDDSNRREEITTALTYKNGISKYELTEGELDIIDDIYTLYHENRGMPCDELKGEGVSDATKQAMKDAYAEVQGSGRLSSLRSRLFLSAKKCPMCGIEATTDLDHYLPESKYKCLAIHSRNLIPTCHKCNNKKRAAVVEGGVGFLHLYYFDDPGYIFFTASTEIKNSALSIDFNIIKVGGMSQDVYESLCYHMRKIDLNDRLKTESNDFLGSMYTSFELTFHTSGIDGLRNLLKKTRDNYTSRYGLNHWKRALMDSLSDNQEFLNTGFKTALGTP